MYFCNFSSHSFEGKRSLCKISTSSHPMTLCGASYDNACRKYQRWCNNINIQKQLLCPQLFRESYRTSNLSSFSFFFSVANSIYLIFQYCRSIRDGYFPKYIFHFRVRSEFCYSWQHCFSSISFLPVMWPLNLKNVNSRKSLQRNTFSFWNVSQMKKIYSEHSSFLPFQELDLIRYSYWIWNSKKRVFFYSMKVILYPQQQR